MRSVVSEITDQLHEQFQNVVEELKEIKGSMEGAEQAMDNIAGSVESTSEAVNNQADMTSKIQSRLEKNNLTAEEAKQITE